jgi:hypothetical protein
MQVKVFAASGRVSDAAKEIEEMINGWLRTHQKIELVDVRSQVVPNSAPYISMSVVIFYR